MVSKLFFAGKISFQTQRFDAEIKTKDEKPPKTPKPYASLKQIGDLYDQLDGFFKQFKKPESSDQSAEAKPTTEIKFGDTVFKLGGKLQAQVDQFKDLGWFSQKWHAGHETFQITVQRFKTLFKTYWEDKYKTVVHTLKNAWTDFWNWVMPEDEQPKASKS